MCEYARHLGGRLFSGESVVPKCSRWYSWFAVLSAAAQQSVAVQGGSAEPVYSVVSPIGESTVTMISMTPRLHTLAGKTVCMAWNRAFKADIALPAIGEQLKQIYPDITIVPYTEMPDAPLPSPPDHPHKDAEDLRVALKAKGCSAFVTGNGG